MAALGLALEALMLFTGEFHRRASVELLIEAAKIERASPSGSTSTTDAMYAVMSGRRGSNVAAGEWALLVVAIGHVGFVVFLAFALQRSFAGAPR